MMIFPEFARPIMFWMVVLGCFHLCSPSVFGQEPKASGSLHSMQGALSRLESPTPSDWIKAEQILQRSMKNSAEREQAICGLALFHVKRGNTEAIKKFCPQIDKFFPERTAELNSLLLRLQLWHDLAEDDATKATEHFAQLFAATQNSEISKASKLASSGMLGAVVGMLESAAAQSPIPQERLSEVKKRLSLSSPADVAQVFTASHERAAVYAAGLTQWLQSHAQQSNDEAQQAATNEALAIEAQRSNIDQMLADARHDSRDAEQRVRQMKNEKRNIEKDINAVLVKWNQHPELHNPIPPDKNAIASMVPKTKRVKSGTREVKKYKTVTDNNGMTRKEADGYETENVYKTERRSQQEIERDTNAIYLPLQQQYQQLMSARQTLLDNKSDAEAKLKDLGGQIPATEAVVNTLRKKIRMQTEEKNNLQNQLHIIDEALRARKSGRTGVAFRPPIFPILDYSLEKKDLVLPQNLWVD